MTQIRSQN